MKRSLQSHHLPFRRVPLAGDGLVPLLWSNNSRFVNDGYFDILAKKLGFQNEEGLFSKLFCIFFFNYLKKRGIFGRIGSPTLVIPISMGGSTKCPMGASVLKKKFPIALKGIRTQVIYFAPTKILQNFSYLILPLLKLNPGSATTC